MGKWTLEGSFGAAEAGQKITRARGCQHVLCRREALQEARSRVRQEGRGWVQVSPLRSVPDRELARSLSSGLRAKAGGREDVLSRRGALAKEGSFGSRSRSVTFQDLPVCQEAPAGPDRWPPSPLCNASRSLPWIAPIF